VQNGVELVNKAGGALAEIVESIKDVANIVVDISTASSEQASGIEQVNKALTQMDEVTQQNSALVEETAATSKTLDQQAQVMRERVDFFRLEDGGQSVQTGALGPRRRPAAEPAKVRAKSRPAPAKQGAPNRAVVGRGNAALAKAVGAEAEWKEF
jgi:methyl-accepting chemotaxis protein